MGGGKSLGIQSFRTSIIMAEGSKLYFKGKAIISEGTVLRCDKNSSIEFGNLFYCNANCYLRSTNSIIFGNSCLLGWDVSIVTSDGHPIWHGMNRMTIEAPITIGNHVWLAAYVKIGKGVNLPNDCVVAQNSVVTKSFNISNTLIGGIPAKEILHNIKWNKD